MLDRLLRRLPGDFASRYGLRPWHVESFADTGYDGTCLRAANFLCVGETTVRGRQDREKRRGKTVKRVFLYPPARNWRRQLGVSWVEHAPVLEPGEGLNAADWAENEFGGALTGQQGAVGASGEERGSAGDLPGAEDSRQKRQRQHAMNAFYRLIEMRRSRKLQNQTSWRRIVIAAFSGSVASTRFW